MNLFCSKEIYPFWKYDKFDLENMDEAQSKREFRFLRSHIYDLKNVLNIPEKNSYYSVTSKFWS